MTLVRRNQNWLPSFFDDFFDNDWMERVNAYNNAVAPAINVKENKNAYILEVAAPGMTKDDFQVHVDEDDNLVIAIESKKEDKEENKDTRYLRHEFSYAKFQQTMLLPEDVDADKIDAKVEHGVLTIDLPKKAHVELPKAKKQICIK
ncbi:MAG: Hsp20/alpha crystallin family protein [Bacteroidales bacterium]|nr:Hsp20/alpha crystallin family protein [Bacteroidales bacterium]